ncbi:MAG TPA: metallopeptidase TldD-related protein [Actinomycetota bacterium]|nr:metallopeptidase TldD-related protein [Actinomycetota bacterium]
MPERIGPDEIRAVAEAALDVRGADGVEVLLIHEWTGLTRFADSAIHQSTAREETGLRVRVVSRGRVGVSAANDLSKEGAAAAARSALELAEVAAPDPLFPGLAPRADVPARDDAYDEATATATPDARAEAVAELVGRCGDGFLAAGAFETSASEVALANTEGQFAYAPMTQAQISTVVAGGDGGNGFAEKTAVRASELDAGAIGDRAYRKARDSQGARELAPGRYEVVLEPAAVATLVGFLSWLGFGGRALIEGRSCFSDRLGEQLMSEQIKVYDDARSPLTIGLPFDFEGTPKRRVELIERGVPVGGVHDRRSAKQAGTESTGHALPPPNPEGAFPLNVFLDAGNADMADMVNATSRGLLVTRFHYSNVVHPKDAIITGMTRDGTWLVEDGEVRHPVKNLRFTQSIIEALRDVELVGLEAKLASEFFFAASRVPALKISSFQFTGTTDH